MSLFAVEGLSEELSCAPDSLVDLRTGAYDCDCEQPNPTVADIVGGAWEWLDDFRGWCAGDKGLFSENWWHVYGDEETPEGAAQSYATYIAGVWMGILTNIVLELVLVCRVHLLGGVPGGPSPRTLKVLRYAVWCQLVPLAVFIPVTSEPVRKSNIAATHFGFPPQVLFAVRPS